MNFRSDIGGLWRSAAVRGAALGLPDGEEPAGQQGGAQEGRDRRLATGTRLVQHVPSNTRRIQAVAVAGEDTPLTPRRFWEGFNRAGRH